MRANNAHLLHVVNQASRSRIAEPQTPLQKAGAGLSSLYNTFDRVFHHRILIAV